MQHDGPKRGEIYWVRLDPTDGSEINKTRPCLIVSSNVSNCSELIVVVPITSNVKRLFSRIEVQITLEGKKGKIMPRQIRSIDRTNRLGKKIGMISNEEMKLVENALRLILEL